MWRTDIENAPKDRDIVVYDPPYQYIARWDEDRECFEDIEYLDRDGFTLWFDLPEVPDDFKGK